jgi:Flp pilus assembly protein TadG
VTVLMVPLVLVAAMLVVQYGLAYHARQVMAGAAQDGAASAARQGSGPRAGAGLADALIEQAAGSLLTSHSTSGSSDGDRVTVTARGRVVSLLPFFPGPEVSARGSARIEEFVPQGAGP